MSRRVAAIVLVVLLACPAIVAAQTREGTPRADNLVGTSHRDVNDSVIGGRGNDVLLGGAGNDRISGGPGSDLIAGGGGRDVIRVRDGVVDRVGCGPGRDRVIADPQDDVGGDCEVVQRG